MESSMSATYRLCGDNDKTVQRGGCAAQGDSGLRP